MPIAEFLIADIGRAANLNRCLLPPHNLRRRHQRLYRSMKLLSSR